MELWLLVCAPRISAAIDRTQTEREQLKTEQSAFEQFAKRMAALSPNEHPTRTGSDPPLSVPNTGLTAVVDEMNHRTAGSTTETVTVESVRSAYCETVMAVPHHENEYDESFVENLEAELGPTLARRVVEGDILTPPLQTAILNQTRQARQQRIDLVGYAETEYEALVEARRQLRQMHETATAIKENLYPRPVRELVQSWDRLEAVEIDCETLLRERQNDIQTGGGTISMWSAQRYFYQPFQWEHPVLSDGLDILTQIRQAKRNVAQAIYNW